MAVDLGVMFIPHTSTVVNLDAHTMISRIDAMLRQMAAMGSSTRSDWHVMDLNIVTNLLNDLEATYTRAKAHDLFLPNYHPTPLQVQEPPNINRVQNTDAQDIMNQLAAMRGQLVNGHESAERASGFHPMEKTGVYDPAFAKMKATLDGAKARQESAPAYTPEVDSSVPGTNVGSPA